MGMPNRDSEILEEVKTEVEINEALQIQVVEDRNSPTYYSRVSDKVEGKLIISWPTHAGMRLLAHRDQLLELSFVRESIPHLFSGMIDDMSTEGLPQLTIIQSSAITRIQRRQNYRIKCMIPLEVTGIVKDVRADVDVPMSFRTTTTDLSAGGLSMRHSRPIPENSLLEVKLNLPDDGPEIRIPCQVMYSDTPAQGQMMYRMGLRFLAISESERARIVRYGYRVQVQGLRP
jgi:c-di-GMP-binding flagellar brake protein YcgR